MLNTFSLKSTQPTNKIDIGQWVNKIKSPEKSLKNKIDLIRSKQLDKQQEKYNLPAVCYNFVFSTKRTEESIVSPTGLLFIDLDKNLEDLNIDNINKDRVFMLYKSLSGQGYHLVVRVNNLSLESFKTTLDFVIYDLGIKDFCDKGAMKYNQLSFYSYDENIFYNQNSFIYSEVKNIIENKMYPTLRIQSKQQHIFEEWGTKLNLRFNNIDEQRIDGMYKVDWNNIDIIEAKLPIKRVMEGKRSVILFSYATNLLYLNQHLSFDSFNKHIQNVNNIITKNPLPQQEVFKICKSIYDYLLKGSLRPIKSKKKRSIIFKQNSGLKKDDKMEIVRDLLSKKKKNESLNKIYYILEEWDFEKYGKISIRKISDNFPISKKTIAKYYPEFKNYIQELNKEFKNN